MSTRSKRGVALLETLIALVILAFGALSTVEVLAESGAASRRADEVERNLRDASRLLTAATLLSSNDLEERSGVRSAGPYEVEILRVKADIYRIRVRQREEPSWMSLETSVYRPRHGP